MENPLARKFDTNLKSILQLLQCREDSGLKRSPDYLKTVKPITQKILEVFDNRPTLQRPGITEPFFRFVILENKEKQTQVTFELEGKDDAKLDNPPFRLIIRLLDRKNRKATRAIYSYGFARRVDTDFDIRTKITDNELKKYDSKFIFDGDETNLTEPPKYTIDFLDEVLDSTKNSIINERLQQQVFDYLTKERKPKCTVS